MSGEHLQGPQIAPPCPCDVGPCDVANRISAQTRLCQTSVPDPQGVSMACETEG